MSPTTAIKGRRVGISKYRGRDSVAERFQKSRGYKTADVAHQRLLRLRQEIPDAIEAHECYPDRFAHFFSLAQTTLLHIRADASPNAFDLKEQRDAHENVVRQRYHLTQGGDREELIRALEAEAESALRLAAGLRLEGQH
jgi:hypothetical protein